MPKLSELIYDIRESVKQFTDDSELDNRYIEYLYKIKRAKYLRQDLNNFQKAIDNSVKQTLCLEMELVDDSECRAGCTKILRSKVTLPKLLELHTKSSITNVKSTDRVALPFNFTTKDKLAYLEGSRYNRAMYAFLDTDNYLYVTSKNESYKLLDCLTITGVFEDPTELENYKNCCSCEDIESVCYTIDSEFPIQPRFIDLIRNEIIQQLITGIQIPEDKENNDND